MKFHRLADVSPNPAAGLICRQSKLQSLVVTVLFSIVLLVPPILSWATGKHHVFGIIFGLFAALLTAHDWRRFGERFARPIGWPGFAPMDCGSTFVR